MPSSGGIESVESNESIESVESIGSIGFVELKENGTWHFQVCVLSGLNETTDAIDAID
jgi:hypothetical protein